MASHMIRGRQLSRDTEHRLALRRNLVQSLFEHGKIRTTGPKAKEVKSLAEKLITQAKKGTLTARRKVIQELNDRRLVDENFDFIEEGPTRTIVQRLFNEVAPKFKGRNGGYTRITKTPDFRIGDGGSIVILQLVTDETGKKASVRRSGGLRRKRSDRRKAFASKVLTGKKAEAAA
jgi:large subunit ribosomal protein L17